MNILLFLVPPRTMRFALGCGAAFLFGICGVVSCLTKNYISASIAYCTIACKIPPSGYPVIRRDEYNRTNRRGSSSQRTTSQGGKPMRISAVALCIVSSIILSCGNAGKDKGNDASDGKYRLVFIFFSPSHATGTKP